MAKFEYLRSFKRFAGLGRLPGLSEEADRARNESSEWGNSAWKVVTPLKGYRKVGNLKKSSTSIGSAMVLPNVYQEVVLQKGDVVLGLVGGDFWIPKGSGVAYPIRLAAPSKHPFERSSGSTRPFGQRWPVDQMEKLPAVPKAKYDRGEKSFNEAPAGAKSAGNGIDVILPAGAKLESVLDEKREGFHHGTVRQWKNGRHLKNGSGWERLRTGRPAQMASKVPAFTSAPTGAVPAGVWEDPNDFSRHALPSREMSAAVINAVAGKDVVGVAEALELLARKLDGEVLDEGALAKMKMVFGKWTKVGAKKPADAPKPAEFSPINPLRAQREANKRMRELRRRRMEQE